MTKQELRKIIAQNKKSCSKEQLQEWSFSLLKKLEDHPAFCHAHTLLLYYSLPDEVQTHEFIEKWKEEKDIILPVVVGDGLLELRRYKGKQDLAVGAYGILEPAGEAFVNFDTIDLAIIPGMAFDAEGNRLGRGKGFYDRLLPKLKATKIGICFGFQVAAHLPIDPYDFPMDEVYTEEGKLSK